MRAHGLPQRSDEEAAHRAEALQRAATAASEIPMTGADCAVRALELAQAAAERASTHVISDVIAGAELLHAATLGLFATLGMNLKAVDLVVRTRLVAGREALTQRAEGALAQIRATSHERAGEGGTHG
jgi:formiminotetrahydrofolate cyclodeaminase